MELEVFFNKVDQSLQNQKVIMIALYKVLLPKATDQKIASIVNALIDEYHRTKKLLNEDYIGSRLTPRRY